MWTALRWDTSHWYHTGSTLWGHNKNEKWNYLLDYFRNGMLNFLKQVLHCDLQTGKKLERVLCPTTSFLPKKGCCLLIPMDHPKDIDTVQLRRQEVVVLGSSGATVSFSRRTVFSKQLCTQKSCVVEQHLQTQTSLQQPLSHGDSHLCPGFPQLWGWPTSSTFY